MIEASGLTKRYGAVMALDHVTFSIQPGEIVGLLGPNGAGKTTMLKLLTGYLPPTEGTAQVCTFDSVMQNLELRRTVGYLPESNPLYEEFAVQESLQWTARLREIPVAIRAEAIRNATALCGLTSVLGKNIGELSKGYRQRVGLAQAIVHDPAILILDEPTSGLDPNQQLEVLHLIQNLKQKKTVLLSTHILSEAQAVCDRVLIINRGKIVADGTPALLSQSAAHGYRVTVELKAPAEAARAAIAALPGAAQVTVVHESDGRTVLTVESSEHDLREAIFALAVREHWVLLQLTPESVSLDDVFRQMTRPEVPAV
jgi:ABC-2 type transport system ATP-binding protein